MKHYLSIIFILAFSSALAAETLYVDNLKGRNSNDGSREFPMKTITYAVKRLKPGSTLCLVKNDKPYREGIQLKDLKGTPGKPIVIDGRMAVLNGSRPLSGKNWTKVEDSLYRRIVRKGFYKERYFLIFDGKIQRMGIYYKLRRKKFKKPGELKPGEWTFVVSENALYVKLLEGQALDDVYEPKDSPSSGVALQECQNLIIKNLIVEDFINDGYNFHGHCKDILMENIIARNCGDDGISAHDECSITVKNYMSDNNPSGICHIGNASVIHENVLIVNGPGVNLLMLNKENVFKNLIIKSDGDIRFRKGKNLISNALFEHPGKKMPLLKIQSPDVALINVSAKSYRIDSHKKYAQLFSEKNTGGFNPGFVDLTLGKFKDMAAGQ